MLKIYIVFGLALIIVGGVLIGERIGRARCLTETAEKQNQQFYEITKTKMYINEKSFVTGVADIRNISHSKYTIAD